MILEDVTTAIIDASDELKFDSKTSICSLRFSLLDSMSAVELLDQKMDQCCGLYGHFHGRKYFDNLFSEAYDSSNDANKTVSVLLVNFENEIAFLCGDSLMESTHTNIFVWNQTWHAASFNNSITNQCILLSSQSLIISLDSVFSGVLAADIYEDEDFSPGFRNHLRYDNISYRDVESSIKALIDDLATSELAVDQKDALFSLLSLRNSTTQLFVLFNLLITDCVTTATNKLRSKSNFVEQNENNLFLPMDAVQSFKRACEESIRCVNLCLEKSASLGKFLTEPIRLESSNSVSNLFLSGPKRKLARVGFLESLRQLSSVISGFVTVVDGMLPLLVGNDECGFEELLLFLCDRSAKCDHLLVRSLMCGLLHCVGVNINKFMSFKYLLNDMASNALVVEWIGGNLTLTAWETVKLLCCNRRKIFARLSSLLSNWGIIISESLYVDEQLKSFQNNSQQFPQICSSWTTLIVTRLMDLFMKLVCESNILQTSEIGYFYWYWDYVLSVNAHVVDKLRAVNTTTKAFVLSKYHELLSKAEGLLARSSFRIYLYLEKYCGLRCPVLKYTQHSTIYDERFKAFHNIPNPTQLSYMDYLHSSNSLSGERVDPQQLLSSVLICLENAKKLLLEARNESSQSKRTVNTDYAVNLLKCVFSSIITIKKLQELHLQRKAIKKPCFQVSEHEYFPKLQYECE